MSQIDRAGATRSTESEQASADQRMWTNRLRGLAVRALPPDKLLPDRQPAYVASWIYVFGVLSLASLVVVLVSGGVLALKGPAWWHNSAAGLFFNSLHLWSVELFFFFMVIHLWGKFFMAAWRGRRAMTWITGAVAFVASIGAAFTGYLSQQNFDNQWIAAQAKDGLNAVGVGAFFNVLDFGQMFTWHVVLLPLGLVALVVVHVLLVRLRGVVPPFPAKVPADGTTRTGGPTSGTTSAATSGSGDPPLASSGDTPSPGARTPEGTDQAAEGEEDRA
jgi:ubiquinol-cytochrome c reductase cytochrome b subunit